MHVSISKFSEVINSSTVSNNNFFRKKENHKEIDCKDHFKYQSNIRPIKINF